MIFSTEKNKKELKKYYFRSFQIISDHESFDCCDFCSILSTYYLLLCIKLEWALPTSEQSLRRQSITLLIIV